MPDAKNAGGNFNDSVASVKRMLDETAQRARGEISKVKDVRAKALFETTAEALDGLQKAYKDYEKKNESAWQ